MRRDDLVEAVKRTLPRLPSEFASHYGVLPEAPTENNVPAGEATASLRRAHHAIGEVSVMAAELYARFVLSRILCRKEAVRSSGMGRPAGWERGWQYVGVKVADVQI